MASAAITQNACSPRRGRQSLVIDNGGPSSPAFDDRIRHREDTRHHHQRQFHDHSLDLDQSATAAIQFRKSASWPHPANTRKSQRMQQHNSGARKITTAPLFIRWVSLFITIAVSRLVWNSILVTRYWDEEFLLGNQNGNNNNQIDFPRLDKKGNLHKGARMPPGKRLGGERIGGGTTITTTHRIRRKRSTHRRRRHLPPPSPPLDLFQKQSKYKVHEQVLVPTKGILSHSISASSSSSPCAPRDSRYPLHPTSRILITGILSHPLGVEIALALAGNCGVQDLVGWDEHALLHASHSSKKTQQKIDEIPDRLSFLLQRLPSIQLHLTQRPWTDGELWDAFTSLQPTHILHLEYVPEPEEDYSEAGGDVLSPIFTMSASIEALDTLLKTVVRYRSHKDSNNQGPHMLYVTTSEYLTNDGESNDILSRANRDIFPRIVSNYRSLYDVQAAHMKLPVVYGPFSQRPKWMNQEFFRDTDSNTTRNQNTRSFRSSTARLIHSKEAIKAILTGMVQRQHDTPERIETSLVVARNQTTSKSKLHQAISQLKSDSVNPTSLRGREFDALRFLMSWSYHQGHPFGRSEDQSWNLSSWMRSALEFTNSGLRSNDVSVGISPLQQRQNRLFPCHSECASELPCLKDDKSAFDSYILSLSQEVTSECKFVVYTADFSKQLDDLVLLNETQGGRNVTYPQDSLCQVAYISGKSRLVTSLVSKHEMWHRSSNDALSLPRGNTSKLTFWNGRVVHNGWTLVWLKHHDSTMLTEAEYMMPKIAPGPLFGSNITRALYFEPKQLNFVPARPILWFLMAKNLDARHLNARYSRVNPGKTIWLPPEPAKHVAFFAHELYIRPDIALQNHESVDASSYLNRMTKYILQQKGLGVDRLWPRRQLQFYEYLLKEPSNHGEAVSPFQLRWADTFLLIHNIQSDRSMRLRCEWYQEQLFWNSGTEDDRKELQDGRNRDLEEISLAYVLAKWRMQKRLIPDESAWGDRIVDPSKSDNNEAEVLAPRIEEEDRISSSSPILESQFFVRLHAPISARKKYVEIG